MNMGYINTMASNLVACYWIEYKLKITAASIRDSLPEICKLALKGVVDTNPKVNEAAKTLIDLLVKEGVVFQDENLPAMPGAAALPAAASQASAAVGVSPDWASIERLATEEAGPMASKITIKVRNESSGLSPRQAIAKFKATLGPDITKAIFSRYKGS